MREYTIDEVAAALDKNPQTIRRLINSQKLSVPKPKSNKTGYKISADALNKFLKENPKYITEDVTALISSSVALPLALSTVVATILTSMIVKNKKKVTPERVEEYAKKCLIKSEKAVTDCIIKVHNLEKELEKAKKELEKAEEQVAIYNRALDEFDFEEIANSINENL